MQDNQSRERKRPVKKYPARGRCATGGLFARAFPLRPPPPFRKLAVMETVTAIRHLRDLVGQTVRLRGWVYHSRPGGKITFLVFRDGTGLCQWVVEKNDASAGVYDDIKRLAQ